MSTLSSTDHTLLDIAQLMHNGSIQKVIEVLDETNDFTREAIFLPANGMFGHTGPIRTSLPPSTWRKYNDGVAYTKGTSRQITEALGSCEQYSRVDAGYTDKLADPRAYRQGEDMAHVEGLGQDIADAFIYADPDVYPERLKGLAPRITSASASNAVDAGGSGEDTTSVWLVQWGENKCCLRYPEQSASAGIRVEDLGKQLVDGVTSSTVYLAYVTHFIQEMALWVPDDRSIQRICNIETKGSSNILNPNDLITALNRIPNNAAGTVIYCNPTIKTQLDIIAMNKSNVFYTGEDAFGKPVTMFQGHPIRRVDAILDTETALT